MQVAAQLQVFLQELKDVPTGSDRQQEQHAPKRLVTVAENDKTERQLQVTALLLLATGMWGMYCSRMQYNHDKMLTWAKTSAPNLKGNWHVTETRTLGTAPRCPPEGVTP